MPTGIEGAVRDDRQVIADGQDLAEIEAGIGLVELTSSQPADVTVGLVPTEAGIDIPELIEDRVKDSQA